MAVLVSHVVRKVIAEHVHEERVLLDAVEQMDPATRTRHLTGGRERNETLGYGLDVVMPLVTSVLWLALTELAQETAKSAVQSTTRVVQARWQRFRRRERQAEPEIIVPLSAQQIGLVREKVLVQCTQAGLNTARATVVANAVFHELSTYSSAGDSSSPGGGAGEVEE
ncbi:hypothetical protein K2224_28760 (plasmid) [Streptomyces sp. BHT-5-2]|uniref:hypothetical protein n=1 Tax=Streptomyces sp. BHT-5-2 TaxID=2866715 RepID=UPI001C8ED8D3|nr:hypothetical protein [Streptomyces sp. BHT-5-2]QZL07274.1 hypothetical protein K2224_28760 [Streptomyces sp. BHT-5-2]